MNASNRRSSKSRYARNNINVRTSQATETLAKARTQAAAGMPALYCRVTIFIKDALEQYTDHNSKRDPVRAGIPATMPASAWAPTTARAPAIARKPAKI
jgi:hypothetical protein